MARLRNVGAISAWNGHRPPARPDRSAAAAKLIIADAQRGAAYVTRLEEHLAGLGRAQLATVVQLLFAELAKTCTAQHKP